MKSIEVKAYAKINLSLDVLSKMEDGMHAMSMVMQAVTLADDLRVTLTEDGVFSAKSELFYLPTDERNLAARAARVFTEYIGLRGVGAFIEIKKRIPVCAGLGGGSSDAAACLRAMNQLTGAGLSTEELKNLGQKLGADVPFCVAGGTAYASGKGEIIENLSPMPDCAIVICKPDFSFSTPEIFARIDCSSIRCRPDTAGMISSIANSDLKGVARRVFNVFEDALPKGRGEIAGIKSSLLDSGALGVSMSGTGPSVFGIFDDERAAATACERLKESIRDCFLCRPADRVSV